MKRLVGAVLLAVVMGLVGLGVGYALFGKLLGDYVHPKYLLNVNQGALTRAAESVVGLDVMRRKIAACGAVGFVVGLALPLAHGRPKTD